jgi:hypothetical protein
MRITSITSDVLQLPFYMFFKRMLQCLLLKNSYLLYNDLDRILSTKECLNASANARAFNILKTKT